MPDKLLHGAFEFRRRWFKERDFLQRLALEGQKPQALYIGCSDSRVVPELLMSAGPGEIFVVRNVANFVPPAESANVSVGAAIEFALGALGVRDIIVCGHSQCGGVKAAVAGASSLPPDVPELRAWIGGIERGLAVVKAAGHPPEVLARRAEEENILASLANLLTFELVKKKLDAGELQLHGWFYDMHTLEFSVFDGERNAFVDARALVS